MDRKQIAAQYQELVEDDAVPYPLIYLAQEYNTSPGNVRKALRREGLDPAQEHTQTYERAHKISELLFLKSTGMAYPEIAKKLGMAWDDFLSTTKWWFISKQIDFNPLYEWEAAMSDDPFLNSAHGGRRRYETANVR